MRSFSLFSGIGGLDAGFEMAGIKAAGFCEVEPNNRKILRKYWKNQPIFKDVRELSSDEIRKKCGTIDLINGGYPCQPYAQCGRRQGKAHQYYLWPEMFRIVQECRPDWVVGENTIGHIRLGLDEVLSNLEAEGYTCRTFDIPAFAVGAQQERARIFWVGSRSDCSERRYRMAEEEICARRHCAFDVSRRTYLDGICRTSHGLPRELDRDRKQRIRALGNAVDVGVAYQLGRAIKTVRDLTGQTP